MIYLFSQPTNDRPPVQILKHNSSKREDNIRLKIRSFGGKKKFHPSSFISTLLNISRDHESIYHISSCLLLGFAVEKNSIAINEIKGSEACSCLQNHILQHVLSVPFFYSFKKIFYFIHFCLSLRNSNKGESGGNMGL